MEYNFLFRPKVEAMLEGKRELDRSEYEVCGEWGTTQEDREQFNGWY
jgi:hypothetical protein